MDREVTAKTRDKLPSSVITGNILIVEDDADTGDLYLVALAQVGYGVRKVTNRQDALQVLGGNLYQVILMDVMLPGPTLDVFMSCRNTLFPASKLILVSAYPEIKVAAERFRIRHWLSKPVDMDLLRTTVRTAMAEPQ